jgi:hypothetical protein
MTVDQINRSPVSQSSGLESECPVASTWYPKWTMEIGQGERLGITIDDGCLVVLYPRGENLWRPGTHIPKTVAARLGEFAKFLPKD